jgi:hypothetical protein
MVGHGYVQRIARIHMQGWVLQAVRRHETEQLSAGRIGGCLVGNLTFRTPLEL